MGELVAITQFFAVALIAVLAYWRRDRLLYVLSGFAFIIYGFNYWSSSNYMSIILVLLGVCSFMKAWLEKGKAVK